MLFIFGVGWIRRKIERESKFGSTEPIIEPNNIKSCAEDFKHFKFFCSNAIEGTEKLVSLLQYEEFPDVGQSYRQYSLDTMEYCKEQTEIYHACCVNNTECEDRIDEEIALEKDALELHNKFVKECKIKLASYNNTEGCPTERTFVHTIHQ